MTDFIPITDDGTNITSRMPADESVVEVKLDDGTTARAWYGCNIMDAGDWDFVPLAPDETEPGDQDSIAERVVAWRYFGDPCGPDLFIHALNPPA